MGRDIAIITIIVMATMVISMVHGAAITEVSTKYYQTMVTCHSRGF
jgi:hypothetical protein